MTLIDTYLLADFIDKDRYFNNLTKDIDEKKENIYFIPTIVTLNRNQIKNLKNNTGYSIEQVSTTAKEYGSCGSPKKKSTEI